MRAAARRPRGSAMLEALQRQLGRWRGIASLVKRLVSNKQWGQLWYPLEWRLRGFDFGSVEVEKLRLDPGRCMAHGNSGGPDLEQILRLVGVPAGSRIVDFGSGKGGATLTMGKFPFAEVLGLDLSPELIRIAQANCRRAGAERIHFLETDATAFLDLDRFTHIYMYHPFACAVVGAVCANLRASLTRRDRRLVLIYKNPVCDPQITESGVFRLDRDLKFSPASPDCERFRIYVHDGSESAGGFGATG